MLVEHLSMSAENIIEVPVLCPSTMLLMLRMVQDLDAPRAVWSLDVCRS